MALVPTSENLEFGPDLEDEMARIYEQLGDADHAIPMLKRLLRTSYGGCDLSYSGNGALDPIWDSIRQVNKFFVSFASCVVSFTRFAK